ncbi:hypothetical protein AB4Y85_17720 [Microvirga sp. 2YAF29]|uniref:cadherin repeat domain-containing protein n=1 Tax=Microvirga sp. 2YAF29 TaxID=3233031 RepID=UPI003F9E69BF
MSGLVFDLGKNSIDFEAAATRAPGKDAFLDRDHSAAVVLGSAPLKALEILADQRFEMGILSANGRITLDGSFAEGVKIYVDGEEIATIAKLTPGELTFDFTAKATSERVEELIRSLTFKDTTGGATFEAPSFIELYLSDTANNLAYVLMEIGDPVIGTDDADVFAVTSSLIGRGDELDGGKGDDALQLNGGGEFDLHRMSKLVNVETILGSAASDTISINSSQWAGIESIDGGGATNWLMLHGLESDLTKAQIANFAQIHIMQDHAKVFVGTTDIAKLIYGRFSVGGEIVISSGTLTEIERQELHRRGIDRITTLEDGRTTIHEAPELTAFGDSVKASAGETVFVDKDRDAELDVDAGALASLKVEIDGAGSAETLGIAVSGGLSLGDGLKPGSELFMAVETPDGTVHKVAFGYVSTSIGTGGNVSTVKFQFDENAKIEWIQQLIRSLTYKSIEGVESDRKITLTLEDVATRKSTGNVLIKPAVGDPPPDPNELPVGIALSGASIDENSAAGAVIGWLSAKDADGDALTYALGDDAGGRFEIRDGKLVVKDGAKLDFEAASSHKISVKVSDGKATVIKDFVIRIDDVTEMVPGATRAKNVLVGGIGADRINGGYGNDKLTGGAGADFFVFDTALGKGTTRSNQNEKVNFDTITDFKPGEDKILLDNAIFKALGKGSTASPGALKKGFFKKNKATDKDDFLIYKGGVVYYDADGNGTKYKPVEIIKIANKAALSAADFLII